MPWKIQQNTAGCKGFAVVKEDGKLVGCHPSKNSAMAHMKALYANEKEMHMKKNISIMNGETNGR